MQRVRIPSNEEHELVTSNKQTKHDKRNKRTKQEIALLTIPYVNSSISGPIDINIGKRVLHLNQSTINHEQCFMFINKFRCCHVYAEL